jgi:S-adenosylmethionine hydrolase
VAAHLSLGRSPADFGERITALTTLPLTRPCKKSDGSVVGHIIYIDSFGNLITDITTQDLPSSGGTLVVKVSNQTIDGLSRTYTEAKGLLALIGSSNRLEISAKDGSARDLLNMGIGEEVRVIPRG